MNYKPVVVKKETILVYVRPWNSTQFHDLGRRVWPHANLAFLSEHPSCDDSGFRESFYKVWKKLGSCDEPAVSLMDQDITEISLRCRLLRQLDVKVSRRLVLAACITLEEVFDRLKPAYILSVTVDSYLLHVLYLIEKWRLLFGTRAFIFEWF